MDPIAWVIVVVIVVAVAVVAWLAWQQRQRAQLQERFGPEYERAVERTGDRRQAEHELSAVAKDRDRLDIQPLDDAARRQWTVQWEAVQARFVDDPAGAVGAADTLITGLMQERGYPTDDFEQRASLVAADHPHVVEHYREAQSAHEAHRRSGEGDTEDLRRAFVHYRDLFTALVEPDDRPEDRQVDVRDDQLHDQPAARHEEVER